MPDKRKHRGSHPQDMNFFSDAEVVKIIRAVGDFSMLISKGYATKSVLKLVGDRFNLSKRQRLAVLRNGCSEEQLLNRQSKMLSLQQIRGEDVLIDGYNLLITIESALSDGFIFVSRDGTFKDLASIHSTYHRVSETVEAIEMIGRFLEENGAGSVRWLLDRPVSNSGRVKKILLDVAREKGWDWEVELVMSPDKLLCETEAVVISSDSVVLDRCKQWVNFGGELVRRKISGAKIIDLREQ